MLQPRGLTICALGEVDPMGELARLLAAGWLERCGDVIRMSTRVANGQKVECTVREVRAVDEMYEQLAETERPRRQYVLDPVYQSGLKILSGPKKHGELLCPLAACGPAEAGRLPGLALPRASRGRPVGDYSL